jgi:hypothetical protein
MATGIVWAGGRAVAGGVEFCAIPAPARRRPAIRLRIAARLDMMRTV